LDYSIENDLFKNLMQILFGDNLSNISLNNLFI